MGITEYEHHDNINDRIMEYNEKLKQNKENY